jgi:hypothetical protein
LAMSGAMLDARPLASLTTLVESEVEFVCSSCDVDAYSRGFFVNR